MKLLILLFVIFIIPACSTPPYVHKAEQFNRSSDDFGKTVTDISHVTICYNTYTATPSEIRKLAFDECERYGKSVSFLEQVYDVCPITAPVAAFYNCVGDNAFDNSYDVQGISKGAHINYDGFKFRY